MSVMQTVEVPANHRLIVDIPREIPTGPVVLTFTPTTADSGLDVAGECPFCATHDYMPNAETEVYWPFQKRAQTYAKTRHGYTYN